MLKCIQNLPPSMLNPLWIMHLKVLQLLQHLTYPLLLSTARNLATSVSGRITLPNSHSGIAFKTHQAIANAGNQGKLSPSDHPPTPPEDNLPFQWLRRRRNNLHSIILQIIFQWLMQVNHHHFKRPLCNAMDLQSLRFLMMATNY